MMVYSVTFAIEESIEIEWLKEINQYFIPTLMKSGFFSDFQHTKIIPEQGLDLAYNLQFKCENQLTLDHYITQIKQTHERALQEKFPGKFASFYTKLELLP